jgi:hypothetical protein
MKPGGSFKIDHPLDPANKYLYHSFVESPDMMNIYNGNTVTDVSGPISAVSSYAGATQIAAVTPCTGDAASPVPVAAVSGAAVSADPGAAYRARLSGGEALLRKSRIVDRGAKR